MYNPFSLIDKTILVTGATSGIGRAIAIECSKMGAKLIIVGRNNERLEDTFKSLDGSEHLKFIVDLTIESELIDLVKRIPILNGIVHAAGVVKNIPFRYTKKSDYLSTFDINFFAPIELSKSILKEKKINNEGSIIFLASIDGTLTSYIGDSNYSTSKAALVALSKSLALELATKKIRVNSILPGLIDTPLINNEMFLIEQLNIEKNKYPIQRFGEPEEIAYAAIYLLSDASKWVTGTNMVIDGGYTIR